MLNREVFTPSLTRISSTAATYQIPLHTSWVFWYTSKGGNKDKLVSSYESNIQPVAKIHSIDSFCAVYSLLARASLTQEDNEGVVDTTINATEDFISNMPLLNDLHFFKEGIKPLWEDPANAHGGKLMFRLKKGLAARLWEHLLILLIDPGSPLYQPQPEASEDMPNLDPESVCGAVLAIRPQEDIISIWVKYGAHGHQVQSFRTVLRIALQASLCLPSTTPVEYRAHDASLKDAVNQSVKKEIGRGQVQNQNRTLDHIQDNRDRNEIRLHGIADSGVPGWRF